jgi:hypothetical protein
MVEAWKATKHFKTFTETQGRPAAKEILSKLGIRRMKSESICIKCHYTFQAVAGESKPIAGVACESCHGPATDWNLAHSNKEDPQRLMKAEKLGMIRPSNTYALAANCFACHTVSDEKLVNVGGHATGSGFELVSWTQGEIRHNMQKSAGKVNQEASPARKRMLYMVGRALDLEYGLRALANASEDGKYAESLIKRVETAKRKLKEIFDATNAEEMKQILEAGDEAQLRINNGQSLLQAADKIGAAARKFSSSNDGAKYAAVDSMIPAPALYKGKVYKP